MLLLCISCDVFFTQFMSGSVLLVKEKTIEGKWPQLKMDGRVNSGGQNFLMITGT